jgi:hypothetical protein
MDKLSHYRNLVKQIVLRHAEYSPSHGQIESSPIFDEHNDHYLLIDFGWDRPGRVHEEYPLRESHLWPRLRRSSVLILKLLKRGRWSSPRMVNQ